MKKSHFQFLSIFISILLLLSSLSSLKLFIADIVTTLPTNKLTLWEKSHEEFSPASALDYIDRLNSALTQSPNNYFLLGGLYEQLAKYEKNKEEKNIYLIRAREQYLQYTKFKPTKALTWSKIAYIEDTLNNLYPKKQMLKKLYYAIQLGPYEPKNQRIIIPLIYKYWSDITKHHSIKLIAIKVVSHSNRYKINKKLVDKYERKYNFNILNAT